ncbi:MAG: motility protein A [Acidimicrobiia bacterium]
MDLASIIGLVLVLVGVFVGMILKGADPVAMFSNVAAILIVIVGSLGAVVASSRTSNSVAALKALRKVFFPGPPPDLSATLDRLTSLADRARREGLLALEDEARQIEDPFFRKALQMAVDGTTTDDLRRALVADVKAMRERHKAVAGWFTQAGVYAPTFGIIGAVVGLIAVMGKLDEPAEMGHGIGAAFVATFWGVLMANGFFLPWSNKLKALSADEVAHRLLIVEGVLSVQQGQSSRAVFEVLSSHLPPGARTDRADDVAA